MPLVDDLKAGFDDVLATGGQDIVYNGGPDPIRAIVLIGDDRASQQGESVADEAIIKVRRSDVTVWSKDTPVEIDGEGWKVLRRISATPVVAVLKLVANRRPVARRAL